MAESRWAENYERREGPAGRPYWWIADFLKRDSGGDDTDIALMEGNWVAVTPLQVDRTDRGTARPLAGAVRRLVPILREIGYNRTINMCGGVAAAVFRCGSRLISPSQSQPQGLRRGATMPLTSPRAMFERAYKEGYAIGAFNVNNMEIIQGIMEAGTEEKAPLILQVSAGARKYAGQNYIVKLIEAGLLEADLPVVLHLDHGADFDICKACVDGGFTSVMIDGSHHSFEENIAVTKRVVEYAHAHGVWVEAELGRLAGVEEDVSSEHSIYTDPDQAVEFVERSGCDSLAIAIGTSHGAYKFKGEAKLDFERLEKIGSLMPGYPLVLHGASSVPQEFVEMCNTYGGKVAGAAGVPEELLRKAAGMAICKNQHRYGYPAGHDGLHPQAARRAS